MLVQANDNNNDNDNNNNNDDNDKKVNDTDNENQVNLYKIKVLLFVRCVDEYFLLVWKKNTAKESGQKLSIANKGTVSFIAEVEACVEYNFVMEYVENDLLRQVCDRSD